MNRKLACLVGVIGMAGCGSSHPNTGYFNMQTLDLAIHDRQAEKLANETADHGLLNQFKQGPGYHNGVHCILTSHQSAVCELFIARVQHNPEEWTDGHCVTNNLSRCLIRTETPRTLRVTIAPDGKSFVASGG